MHSIMQRYNIHRLPNLRNSMQCDGTSTHYNCRGWNDVACVPTYI